MFTVRWTVDDGSPTAFEISANVIPSREAATASIIKEILRTGFDAVIAFESAYRLDAMESVMTQSISNMRLATVTHVMPVGS